MIEEEESPRKLDPKFKAEQALLSSLVKPRHFHKKDASPLKTINISSKDMKSYREKHQTLTGDMSSDSTMINDVRQLHHQKLISGPNNTPKEDKIAANALRRRDRHTAAQEHYQSQLKDISEHLEADILRISDSIKDELTRITVCTSDHFTQLTNEAWLIAASHNMVQEAWAQLEALWKGRTKSILDFEAALEAVEHTRSILVGKELQLLTEALVDAAFVLTHEVERLIEVEAYELNVVLITNRRSHCYLVSRLLKEDVQKFVGVRAKWEACEQNWRSLHHNHAIVQFRSTLESSLYTHPPAIYAILERLQKNQIHVHTNERLALLNRLDGLVTQGALTTADVHAMVTSLTGMFKHEEERNAIYFDELFSCQKQVAADAVALREGLRASCHIIGAKADEGNLASLSCELTGHLNDPSLEEFFRLAGGLRADLSSLEERLASPEMIYQDKLFSVVPRVQLLVAALPLETVLDSQGKSGERAAVIATLERLRKALKQDIVPTLPVLKVQAASLAAVAGIDDILRTDLEDICVQLDRHIEANTTNDDISPATTPSKGKTGLGLDSVQVNDLAGIRKTQRRLAALVYAPDLPPHLQSLLRSILQALQVQTHANNVVDEIVAAECDELLATRQREMDALVAAVGAGLEAQTTQLYTKCDRVVRFFYQLASCMEAFEEKTRVVNLTVLDLLDTLKDSHDTNIAALEETFSTKRSALRHAPDENTLEEDFRSCHFLLDTIEDEYRKYNLKVTLASTNHPKAIALQNQTFLNQLCVSFGLLTPSNDSLSTNLDDLLSADVIERNIAKTTQSVETQAPATVAATNPPPAAPSADAAPQEEPPKPTFSSLNGREYVENATLEEILSQILQRKILLSGEDASEEQEDQTPTESSTEVPPAIPAAPGTHDSSLTIPVDAAPDSTPASESNESPKIEIRLESLMAVLDVPVTTYISMLEALRNATMASFESRSASHLSNASAESKTRVDAFAFLLEECLRMHWPRKGRTDVQIYQPRAGELVSHRQRHSRHVSNIAKKLKAQDDAFAVLVEEAQKCLRDQENAQLGLYAQLVVQTSLAALQGLESRSKKSHIQFKATWSEVVQVKLGAYVETEAANLVVSCRELVTTCMHQIFPDLVSCDVISGCDYHPDEIKLVEALVTEAENKIHSSVAQRKQAISDLEGLEANVTTLLATFKARYMSCLHTLSMKEGLGQKYGLPRRSAQERLRSEMARSEGMAAAIDSLLAQLQTVASSPENGSASGTQATKASGPSNTARLVRKLMLELRHLMYTRGLYLGILRHVTQLHPRPVPDDLEASTKYDVDEQFADEPTRSFMDLTHSFEAQCISDTCALFAAEGTPLDPANIPETLQSYLTDQREKAKTFAMHQATSFRTQVDTFETVIVDATRRAMEDIVTRAKSDVQTRVNSIVASFSEQFAAWEAQKEAHKRRLSPDLCSPNQTAVVQALCSNEAERTAQVQEAIKRVRCQVLVEHVTAARAFHVRLMTMFSSMMALLDNCTMAVDLEATGSESEEHKRKSLKRLRKALRKLEHGDPLAVFLTKEESQALEKAKESPRLPKRSWPGIPVMPVFDLPKEVKEDMKEEMQLDTTTAAATGACVAYLTDVHRATVKSRNQAHAAYVEWFQAAMQELGDKYTKLLQDEGEWCTNWTRLVQGMHS
ncbi:unnamed protein product [Aphanomyces euteiches]